MSDERRQRIEALYDPQSFAALGKHLVERLEKNLTHSMAGARSLDWEAPALRVKREARLLAQAADAPNALSSGSPSPGISSSVWMGRAEVLAQYFLDGGHRLHSPKYVGHQVAPAIPAAALFNFLAETTNQATGVYEMGPMAVPIERAVIERMGIKLGWDPEKFAGIATNGGSIANLTAILAARNHRYPDFWAKGFPPGKRPAVIASTDSHYSISRAAGVLGLGANQVLKAPLDERRRMNPEAVRVLLHQAIQDGLEVFCLVGTAGTTPIGAFDPLRELGEIAREYKLWFHVDGAHGASYVLSPQSRDKVAGIELADSVVWDAHKLLFTPALSTFVMYREKAPSFGAFDQDAPYLLEKGAATDQMEFDPGFRTLECTRAATAAGIWGVWSIFGDTIFADLIDTVTELTQKFYQKLNEAEDFEPLHEPEANILCFRHLPAEVRARSVEDQSRFQQNLRRRLLEEGPFYITQTKLDGLACLRVTLMNPLTTPAHLNELLERLRELGRGL